MKKKVILVFIIINVATFFSLKAQEKFYEVFAGGVTSTLTNNAYGGFNMPGVSLGMAYEEAIGGHVSWRAELYFVQKGDREVLDDDPLANQDFNRYRARINMMELAFLLRYEYEPMHLIFEGGLAPGVTISQREDNFMGETGFGKFAPLSVAGLLGAHYQFHENWTFGFRMSFSLTPNRRLNMLGGPVLYDYLGGQGQRAQLISLMVGYRF